MKKGMGRKGLSDVVTTVLIILFAIVAVAVVGGIVMNQINKAGKNIDSASFCTSNSITPISCVQDTSDLIVGYQQKTNDNEVQSVDSININIENNDGTVVSQNVPGSHFPTGNGHSYSYPMLGIGGSAKQVSLSTSYTAKSGGKNTCKTGPLVCEGAAIVGNPGGNPGAVCGNGACEAPTENSGNCLADCSVGNSAPSVSITSPSSGSTFITGANIDFLASASDSDGTISQVQFFRESTNLLGTSPSTSSPYAFSWNNVAAGSYSITARATDDDGAVTTSNAILINVNNPGNNAPSVSVTSPSSGSTFNAPASVSITATASDSDGTISQVEFYEGTNLLGTDTSSPYAFSWNNVAAGSYTLTAKATDNLGGQTTSAGIPITINSAPGGSLPTGYIGYWNFEGNFEDSSSNNYDGTGHGGIGFTTLASGDQAGVFDGDNDDVQVSSAVNPGEITVSTWVKSDTATWNSYAMLIAKQGAYILNPGVGNTNLEFYIYCGGAAKWSPGIAVSGIDSWHMYTGVYDGDSIKLYRDAVLISASTSGICSSNDIDGTTDPLYFGHYTVPSDKPRFEGQMDEILIYDRGLTSTEINQIYTTQGSKFGVL
ncbi:MAG: Ig-like domain-containing protein [Nanoarchaeota archaeon]|nr:Ig-like domain-containing protein [Nanoarchaeota archaeon]